VYRWIIFCHNLLGDPELPVWTSSPGVMAVDHPDTVTRGPSNFLVTVNSGDAPIQGALVCAMKANEVYEYGLTNSSGQLTLSISPATLGTMDVTVTARNYLPYEGVALVVPGRDVGVFSIDSPPDTVDTNSVHTPRATVENFGDSTETFEVACWFDSAGVRVYADTQTVAGLASGSQIQVPFANWTACSGTGVAYQMRVTTLLLVDTNPGNNSRQKVVTTRPNHDVATISIDSPPDSVYPDSTYAPRATFRNYGDVTETFEVGCWFDSAGVTVYADTETVVGLGSGLETQIPFANWTACPGALVQYQMTVATLLAGDSNPANNSEEKSVTTLEYHDVGTASIQSPPDTVNCDSTYIPEAFVENFGNVAEDFAVFCSIDGYGDTVQVLALGPGSSYLVQFTPWTVPAGDSTTYLVTVTTVLSGDLDPSNDTQEKQVFAYRVGVEEDIKSQFPISSFQLGQNFPNPFSRETQIAYSVWPMAETGDAISHKPLAISLRVYDLSGRLIRTLVDGRQEPGLYQAVWDARDNSGLEVPSGIYFYRMASEERVLTKKTALLR